MKRSNDFRRLSESLKDAYVIIDKYLSDEGDLDFQDLLEALETVKRIIVEIETNFEQEEEEEIADLLPSEIQEEQEQIEYLLPSEIPEGTEEEEEGFLLEDLISMEERGGILGMIETQPSEGESLASMYWYMLKNVHKVQNYKDALKKMKELVDSSIRMEEDAKALYIATSKSKSKSQAKMVNSKRIKTYMSYRLFKYPDVSKKYERSFGKEAYVTLLASRGIVYKDSSKVTLQQMHNQFKEAIELRMDVEDEDEETEDDDGFEDKSADTLQALREGYLKSMKRNDLLELLTDTFFEIGDLSSKTIRLIRDWLLEETGKTIAWRKDIINEANEGYLKRYLISVVDNVMEQLNPSNKKEWIDAAREAGEVLYQARLEEYPDLESVSMNNSFLINFFLKYLKVKPRSIALQKEVYGKVVGGLIQEINK